MHPIHHEIVFDLEHGHRIAAAEQFHRRLEAAGREPDSLRASLRRSMGGMLARMMHPRRRLEVRAA
jgi:hypothetical protein